MSDTPRFANSRLLSDCVHCGLCLDACPTYKEMGHEPDSPRGRLWLMKALAEGRVEPTATVVGHLDNCLGCRACETACPSGVQYGTILESARAWLERPARPDDLDRGARAHRSLRGKFLRRVIVGRVMADPGLFRFSIQAMRLADQLGLGGLAATLMPRGFESRRWAGALRPEPMANWMRFSGARSVNGGGAIVIPGAPPLSGRLAFLTGCVMSGLFGRVNEASVRVLAREGWEVLIPTGATCCGALAAHAGLANDARRLAERTASRFGENPVDWIVTNAAGCGAMLKEYDYWTSGGGGLAARARDVSQILAQNPLRGPLMPPYRLLPTKRHGEPIRVVYHDACHLAHGQRITDEPRALLAQIPGLEIVPLAEGDVCCGSAGSYNILEPEMAARLGHRKAGYVRAARPDIVTAGNVGCLVQIRGSLAATEKSPLPTTAHLMEILDASAAG
ncbi:MAG: heterodisulfide reductase-related iron-sulfur binding cluster [Candidatus Eisenbacteria bacterium]|nr:heterodisulfide reductase-related iron-sulfur binding cluster [Candidatus Eisenbacteria bacterium]